MPSITTFFFYLRPADRYVREVRIHRLLNMPRDDKGLFLEPRGI